MPTSGAQINVERIQVSPTISNSIFLLLLGAVSDSAASLPLHRGDWERTAASQNYNHFVNLSFASLSGRCFSLSGSRDILHRKKAIKWTQGRWILQSSKYLVLSHRTYIFLASTMEKPHICYLLLCWESKHLPPWDVLKAQRHWAILSHSLGELPWLHENTWKG